MSGSAEGAGPGADLAAWGDELYTLGEAQLPAWARDRKSKGPGDEDKRAPIEDVISALAAIPNDDGWDVPATWDEWSRIGMAVWGATGGSDEGLLAWTLWSERCEFKHDPAQCEERWDHWTVSSPPTDIGIGALVIAAKEATGGRWRRPSRSPEAEFDREEDPGEKEGRREGEEEGEERASPAPFRALLERVCYHLGRDCWFDLETRRMMREAGLMHLAGRTGVKGHSKTGEKSIAARLRGHPDPQMKELIGLACVPGAGPLVEGEDELGRKGLLANQWIPSALVPTDGDVAPWLEFTARLIEDEDDRNRADDWQAWVLQNPGQKVNHALVLLGKYHGSGKDTYFKPFIAAVGRRNTSTIPGNKMGGNFNSDYTKPYLLINEMPHAHKRDIYEDMKPLLASPPELLRINEKKVPEYWIPNIINVMSTTNEPGAIALADDDRRFDVIQTRPAVALSGDELADSFKRAEYFTPLHRWLNTGGNGAVFGWLLRRDVSAFNPHRSPPRTQAKIEMTRAGARPGVDWTMDLVAAGGSLAQRELVSIVELMDLARRGAEGAGTIVANWITPDDVSRGLTLSGWRKVARASIESRRHQIWARGRSPELLAKLPERPWDTLLEEDRRRGGGVDF